MLKLLYLDNNATTPPLRVVMDAVLRTMKQNSWNPSSAHSLGTEARALLEKAQDGVCTLLPGIVPEGVIFTSGGTEGNNLVIGHHTEDAGQWALITSRVEHPSVLRPAEAFVRRGGRITFLEVSPSGKVSPEDAAQAARDIAGPVKVSIQWANSETGVIQPVGDIARAVKAIARMP